MSELIRALPQVRFRLDSGLRLAPATLASTNAARS
jgi:hypothetical protein